jgi:hypothetical protein
LGGAHDYPPDTEAFRKPARITRHGRADVAAAARHRGQLLFTVLSSPVVQVKVRQAARIFAPLMMPPAAARMASGGGSGGDRSPTPATLGRAPKFAARQWTPPAAVSHNESPRLLIEPTLIGPPDLPIANNRMSVWGDRLGKIGPPSNGPGNGAESGTAAIPDLGRAGVRAPPGTQTCTMPLAG